MVQSYLAFFCMDGLLAVAGWPGAAQKDFKRFWHSRFTVDVPEELNLYCFPQLTKLESDLSELRTERPSALTKSMESMPAVLRYFAKRYGRCPPDKEEDECL
ncbi:hypothetical protein CYMTET_5341 [Cymbomonas tetramitiformis]|uniref:Uncharacterized protein n=1 Tax=Cymbomonas tetramitiformis TaxID=36881 RepID=A0AAE0LJK4_9CHLO|nr:hypothetical protein CYMTET_5341 [Cymbomonas tetramitiformis]